MPLTLDENQAHYQIRSYQPGEIQVNEQIYNNSIIVGPNKLIEHWAPQSLEELTSAHLAVILELHPTLLLLGTGNVLRFPPLDVYGHLINQGIGVEVMDTRAACRTYNALTSENRDVLAALIIEPNTPAK